MPIFRRKPDVVEAYQVTEENLATIEQMFVARRINDGTGRPAVEVTTRTGVVDAREGMWVLKSWSGEAAVMEDHTFRLLYGAIDDAD